MGVNKFVFKGVTKFDISGDTVTADKLDKGVTAHDRNGDAITGTSTKDMDTSAATALDSEILAGKTAGVKGSMRTGTMPNKGGVTLNLSTTARVSIPVGYHDGSGSVGLSETDLAKFIPSNIRDGVTILGKTGTLKEDEPEIPQDKTVTPTDEEQVVTPDEDYTCLRQVTVKAIPYAETATPGGGTTITIG